MIVGVSPYSQVVRDEVEKLIALKIGQGMGRKLAALKLLEEQPGWFKQTEEGEYLLDAISNRTNWVNTYQWAGA